MARTVPPDSKLKLCSSNKRLYLPVCCVRFPQQTNIISLHAALIDCSAWWNLTVFSVRYDLNIYVSRRFILFFKAV
jgi:hypothetical protein